MPVCCPCNGSGKCRNCSCSRSGKNCVNCLPSKRQLCVNTRDHHDHAAPDNTAVATDLQAQQALNGDGEESRQGGTANDGAENAMDETEPKKSPASKGMGEPNLPPFAPACSPDSAYMWGSLDGPKMCDKVIACYNEVIHWKRMFSGSCQGRQERPL